MDLPGCSNVPLESDEETLQERSVNMELQHVQRMLNTEYLNETIGRDFLGEGAFWMERIPHPCGQPVTCINYLAIVKANPKLLDQVLTSHACLAALKYDHDTRSVHSHIQGTFSLESRVVALVLIKHGITPHMMEWVQFILHESLDDDFLVEAWRLTQAHDRARIILALARCQQLERLAHIAAKAEGKIMGGHVLLVLYEYVDAAFQNDITSIVHLIEKYTEEYQLGRDGSNPYLFYYATLWRLFGPGYFTALIKPEWEGEPWEQYPRLIPLLQIITERGSRLLPIKYREDSLVRLIGITEQANPAMVAFIRRYHM